MSENNTTCFDDFESSVCVFFWTYSSVITVITVILIVGICRYKRRMFGYYLLDNQKCDLEYYRQEFGKYKKLYENAEIDKESAQRRLSQLMSNRVTDGNPNIANLSDTKRPTKLAEEFSELYDNTWTDAFDALARKHVEPREGIQFLLDILKFSFNWCSDKANRQFSDLNQLLTCSTGKETLGIKVNPDVMKNFKDERKRLAKQTAEHISEEVLLGLIDHFKHGRLSSLTKLTEVSEYCKKCAELCWFFEVQDPPMDIQFNKGVVTNFKAYTKTGKTVDYIVWPPLFLHRDGAMMSKGVAQFQREN